MLGVLDLGDQVFGLVVQSIDLVM